jgi:protein translocase SEC61 complex gamma subunit
MVLQKIKDLYERTLYVWRVSKQPTREDISENFKIVAIGIVVMGTIGFIISVLFRVIENKV